MTSRIPSPQERLTRPCTRCHTVKPWSEFPARNYWPDGPDRPSGPLLVGGEVLALVEDIDPLPDGPRYAAMGNAVTVPVAHWIGERIMAYERGDL